MKVLLLYLYNKDIKDEEIRIYPYGLYSIAANLIRENHEVKLIKSEDINSIIDEIKEFSPDVVGMTQYTINRFQVIDAARRIKDEVQTKVVLGGPHATFLSSELLQRYDFIDYILKGESEISFIELLSFLNNEISIEKVTNLSYKSNDAIVNNDESCIDDLNELENPAKYFSYQNLVTSRGCSGKCNFCSTPKFWKNKIRFKSAENIYEEMLTLYENYGVDYFIFSDDTFLINKDRINKLLDILEEKSHRWIFDIRTRIDHIEKNIIERLFKNGLVSLSIGLESGDENILKWYRKNIDLQSFGNKIRMIRKIGIDFNIFVIVGAENETDETIENTIKLIEEIKPIYLTVYKLHIYPGTELYNIYSNKDYLLDYYFNDENPENSPEFYKDLDRLEQFYLKVQNYYDANSENYQYTFEELKNFDKKVKNYSITSKLGFHYLNSGEYDKADYYFKRSLRLYESPEVLYAYSGLMEGFGDFEQSSEMLIKSKEIFENLEYYEIRQNHNLYLNFAILLFSFNEIDRARALLKKSLYFDNSNFMKYLQLARIYKEYGNDKQAKNCVRNAKKRYLGSSSSFKKMVRNYGLVFEYKEDHRQKGKGRRRGRNSR